MLPITKKISKYNHTIGNRTKATIKYIVIHWVGAVSSAKANATYFAGGNRNASAHYFVDDNSIYQVVLDKNMAWHCGGGKQDQGSSYRKYGAKFYQKCNNSNSIGIEMCLDKKGHVSEKTYKNTGELIKYLMDKYDVPASNVIRHFDVTGKICPGTLYKDSEWIAWKKKYISGAVSKPPVKTTPVKALPNSTSVKTTPVKATPAKTLYYKLPSYKGGSLSDALKNIGVNNSFSNRRKIAKKNGISAYIGTSKQNTALLKLLRSGKLKKV